MPFVMFPCKIYFCSTNYIFYYMKKASFNLSSYFYLYGGDKRQLNLRHMREERERERGRETDDLIIYTSSKCLREFDGRY